MGLLLHIRLSTLLLVGVAAASTAAWCDEGSPATLPLHLRCDQVLPAWLGTTVFERMSDGARIDLPAGGRLSDLLPGAYRCAERTILLRTDDSVAGQALSAVGLPILALDRGVLERQAAFGGQGFNEFSLPVYAWSLGDGWTWPWVTHGSYWGGLAGICWRITTDGQPYRYVAARGAYVLPDQTSIPIVTTPPSRTVQAVRLGDLIAAKGVTGILVRDLGIPGVLDPADEVVTACIIEGAPARVRVMRLGDLVGEQAIDLFTRDRPRGEDRNKPPPDPDNPLHQMSLRRQLIALGGMFALCAIMMLRYRRLRQQSRRRVEVEALRPRR